MKYLFRQQQNLQCATLVANLLENYNQYLLLLTMMMIIFYNKTI